MINVLVKLIGNNYDYLQIKGHANSDEHGKDLVCAGVSSIITGGLNALELIDFYEIINFTDGLVEVDFKGNITGHDNIVVKTIITQLKTMANSYSKFIKITEKGKC